MSKSDEFVKLLLKVEKRFANANKRLAGEGWKHDWQTLFATILSAQSRDETTIPIAEKLFSKYPTLQSIAISNPADIKKVVNSINYNNTKSRNIVLAANYLLENHQGKVPSTIDELVLIPGVGRKTANLVLAECFGKQAICVDTHVHKISNMFGFVKTKNPFETELALQTLVPKKYWHRINRAFVLWGKQTPRYDKDILVSILNQEK